MKEQHRTHGLSGLEERQEVWLIPVVTVHHRVQFRTLKAEDVHGAIELVHRRPDVLYGQGGQAREALWPLAGHGGNLVVHVARQLPPLRWFQMVAEQRRMNRDHLHVDALRLHVLDALLRSETQLGRDSDAFLLIHDNPRAIPRLVPYPVPGIAGINGPPQTLRHQMGMDVDTAHTVLLLGAGRSTLCESLAVLDYFAPNLPQPPPVLFGGRGWGNP